MPKWTNQQQMAIDVRNKNVLVSAAAGSGKTAVLVERVLNIITNDKKPVDVDKLLVVTFTNAAAAEMKSRVTSALEERLKKNPKDNNLVRQLSLVSGAKICTIDSFCINLVRENFFNIGINRDFTILNNTKADVLEETAINNVLDNYFEKKDPLFLKLVDLVSSPKNDSTFSELLKKIHTYMNAQAFPFVWLSNAVNMYNPKISAEDSPYFAKIKNEVIEYLNFGKDLINQSKKILDKSDELYDGYLNNLNSDMLIFDGLISALELSWDKAVEMYKNISFMRIASKRGYESPVKEEISSARNTYKKIITNDLSKYFCISLSDNKDDLEELYPILNRLYEVVCDFSNELFELKQNENAFTFSDIEHFTVDLLYNLDDKGNAEITPFANDLQKDFYEILIDEYQDTNKAQDMIFSALSSGNNRFMVGDIKQSIYRFRLAMPEIFNEKKNTYTLYNPSDSNCDNAKIILDKNFRSRKGICDFVNFLFSVIMKKEVGDIEYNKDEFLNYGADYGEEKIPPVQIKILDNVKSEYSIEEEATCIAKTILNKINSKEQIWDSKNKQFRNVDYGDFAILLRSAKKYIGQYNEILTSFGIPVVCDDKSNLLECNEIKLLLSYLQIIDNPMQDVALLSVMMSAVYGFSADEMAQIRINSKKGSLYSAVLRSDTDKVKNFLNDLKILRKNAVTMSVSYFIKYLCEYKNIYSFAKAMGNGEQRCQNINSLIAFAEDFDASDSVGLTSFMRLITKVQSTGVGIENQILNSGMENAVSLMSIHHSKGLEFPIVMLAGAARQYNTRSLSDKFLLSPSGIGVKRHNEEYLYQTPTLPYYAVQKSNKEDSAGENLRVLYVALTRAKEQFIVFETCGNSIESKINKLASKINGNSINPYYIKRFDSDGDYILLAALLHENGKVLREKTKFNITPVQSDFDMKIEFVDDDDIKIEEIEVEKVLPNMDIVNSVTKKLDYTYPYMNLSEISAKRNASELDKREKSFKYFATKKPAFLNKSGMTPSQKGTAMHMFMQFCDYENATNNLDNEISCLVSLGYISNEQANSLDKKALKELFSSSFAKRMFNSSVIHREMKVSSFVKLSQLNEINSDEEVLIQGICDCVFEENGELVLVDYKTDKVNDEHELLEMYKNQIGFYKNAVSKTLNKKVKQAVLYSFHLGKICCYE